ncbi:hypothetical protein Tco_0784221 [Tanacetum coccineum]
MSTSATYNAIMKAGGKDRAPMLVAGSYVQWKSRIRRYIATKPNHELINRCIKEGPFEYQMITYPEVSATDTDRHQLETTKKETNSIVMDAYANAKEMWIAIERLMQGENINKKDVETNLFRAFGKFTSWDGETLESYHCSFYKLMNELVRNKYIITPHQVNVQFLLQLQPEWPRFVTIAKQEQDLKEFSYHTLFDILKQHQNEVNEFLAERLARHANPLALFGATQQQPTSYPQPKPNYNPPITRIVSDEEETPRDTEISKLMALISTSFKKVYKPTNNNLRTSSNTRNKNVDNTLRTDRISGHTTGEYGEPTDQDLEAHYMYMAKIQEVIPATDEATRPVFDKEPLEQVHKDDYNVFAIKMEHLEQPESIKDTYVVEQGNSNTKLDSSRMSTNGADVDQDEQKFQEEQAYGLLEETKVRSTKAVNTTEIELYQTKQKLSNTGKQVLA